VDTHGARAPRIQEATIRLTRRPSRWRDRLRAYVVIVDGHEAGEIKNGATEDFAVPLGDHTLCLKIDWKGSAEVPLHLAAGEVAEFVCEANGSALTGVPDLLKRDKPWIALARV
jgi:hypothetical protein